MYISVKSKPQGERSIRTRLNIEEKIKNSRKSGKKYLQKNTVCASIINGLFSKGEK